MDKKEKLSLGRKKVRAGTGSCDMVTVLFGIFYIQLKEFQSKKSSRSSVQGLGSVKVFIANNLLL